MCVDGAGTEVCSLLWLRLVSGSPGPSQELLLGLTELMAFIGWWFQLVVIIFTRDMSCSAFRSWPKTPSSCWSRLPSWCWLSGPAGAGCRRGRRGAPRRPGTSRTWCCRGWGWWRRSGRREPPTPSCSTRTAARAEGTERPGSGTAGSDPRGRAASRGRRPAPPPLEEEEEEGEEGDEEDEEEEREMVKWREEKGT